MTGSRATNNLNTVCGKRDRGKSGWPGDHRALGLKPCDLESFVALDKSISISLSFSMCKMRKSGFTWQDFRRTTADKPQNLEILSSFKEEVTTAGPRRMTTN